MKMQIPMNRNRISQTSLSSRLCELLVTLLLVTELTGCGGGLSGDENETDPVVVDNPVAFIKRPLALVEADNAQPVLDETDIRNPADFSPGAVLYLKDRATPAAVARDLTSGVFADPSFLNDDGELLYDVKDLDVSYDGRKLLFAMRAPEIEGADEADQPKWNIWEYDVDARQLRQISPDGVDDGDDIAPTYLPDGRILFSSARQRRSRGILQDEGRDEQYAAQSEDDGGDAFVLHVMNADGTNIRQLTFNQSHDLDPVVMSDGTIVFSRWDNAGGTQNNGMNLYRINPDGTGLSYVYGRHSHDDGIQFVKPQQAENGNIVVQLRAFLASPTDWQPTEVDFRNYVELNVPLVGTGDQGHYPVVNGMDVNDLNEDGISLNGVYGVAFPLYDNSGRYLTSWSPCLLVPADPVQGSEPINCTQQRIDSGDYVAAVPHFGLWIRDTTTDTQLPIEQESAGGIQYDEAVLMNSRSLPDDYVPALVDTDAANLASLGYGILHIRSVYDFGLSEEGVTSDGLAAIADPQQTPPAQRPARFIRIEKPVSMPSDEVLDFDGSAFGRDRNQGMREILGYAPVEPDGSVKVAVPVNVAFSISVLNASGERITARHNNWLQVAPGETLSCNGCHTGNSTVPHGRPDAEPESINPGAITTGVPYPNANPDLSPEELGATMAETYARLNGVRRLTPDIVFEDEWSAGLTDEQRAARAFNYAYADLETDAPISTPACQDNWFDLCRIVINYEQHIHPLWSVDRRIFDGETVQVDHTCTSCHAPETDDGQGNLVASVPAGQLDLTDGPSDQEADHFKSYRELLFGDNEQEVDADGNLIDRLEGTGQYVQAIDEDGNPLFDEDGNPVFEQEVDENGDPLFDENGDPVFVEITRTVPVGAVMRAAGAVESGDFLDLFITGGLHQGYLSPAELKLIREWLDIGAQYYNNPFDPGVPVN